MRVLIIYAHPVADSFGSAMREATLRGLAVNGHEVRVLDLYVTGFEPSLSAGEHADYFDEAKNTRLVTEHVAHLQWAEGLVFVFPTWWYGLPAIMKGWLDRCLVPGSAFRLDGRGLPILPGLTQIRFIAGVTSCGSSWRYAKWVGEPHRRMLMRGIRALCARGCKKLWLAHFNMDTAPKPLLTAYLLKIEQRFARIR